MFSPNPYTRRRQQAITAIAALSGIAAALLLVNLPQLPKRSVAPKQTIALASFGQVALSPDGTRQIEFKAGQVVLRDRATQQPLAIFKDVNIKGVRFTPGGSEILLHTLQAQNTPGSALPVLADHVIVLDPITGQKKGEGPFILTR